MITLLQFANAMGCTLMTAESWHEPFLKAMSEWGINSTRRIAMFLANAGHESASLSQVDENLNYSAQRLMGVWPRRFPTIEAAHYYEHSPERLANLVYASRMGNGGYESGDGWRYHGRGPIQITGADNYRRAGIALNLPLIEQPELVSQPANGARVAAWYWTDAGCNASADADDFDGACDRVNIGRKTLKEGDTIGFAERLKRYEHALEVLQ
jgi:putative chitinase